MFQAVLVEIPRFPPRCVLPIPMSAARPVLVAILALFAVAGCRDAPTMPHALQQIAGGEAWVAIPEPAGLPGLGALLPYVGAGPAAAPVLPRLRALEAEAREARVDGRLDRARELERRAVGLAVASLERAPDPRLFYESLHGLAEWSGRVDATVDLRVYPDIAASLRLVQRATAGAWDALESGDTSTAVLRMMRGAEAVRAHGPTAVALRVLGRAESRLRQHEIRTVIVDRAIHLVRSARQELVAGDPSRALRRGLYALQLLEGRQVPEPRVVR